MKIVIQSISLLIILSLGFFSCKTASIMKRHYNKGYYISKKHSPAETKIAERNSHLKTTSSPELKPAEELVTITAPGTGKDVTLKNESSNEKTKRSENKKSELPPVANTFNKLKNPFEGVVGMPRHLKESLKQNDVARDALSLLWILILILLIVYVIGLILDLFGLGPVFHILGIIILILLILWLLRII